MQQAVLRHGLYGADMVGELEAALERALGDTAMQEAALGGLGFVVIGALDLEKELLILAGFFAGFGQLQIAVGMMQRRRITNAATEILNDIFRMPETMRGLAVVQFFSWFALFAMWIYTTAAVTRVHYGAIDTTSAAYATGADWVGVLFGVYNGVAALAAFAVLTCACGLAWSFWSMVAARFLAGVSAAFVSSQIWASIPVTVPRPSVIKVMGYATAGLAMCRNILLPDTAEGMAAFLEKRAPSWACRGSN